MNENSVISYYVSIDTTNNSQKIFTVRRIFRTVPLHTSSNGLLLISHRIPFDLTA
jgi:DNA-binding IclR family transcriptional regulator